MDEEVLGSKCRLCGIHETKTYTMIHIFTPDNYVSKIHRVLPLSINEYDPLPKKMCYACHYRIVDFNAFVDKSIRTQEILKRELSWCQNDDNVVHSKPSGPLMEVIKDGAKNLNGSSEKAPQLHQQMQKLNALPHVDEETVKDNSNSSRTDDKTNKSCVNNIASSASLNTKSSRNTISTSPVSNVASQKHLKSSPVVSSIDIQNNTEKDLSTSEDLESKREKLLLTLKKSDESSDTWSVPPADGNKKRRLSGEDHSNNFTHKGNMNVKTVENDKNHKGVISKSVNNICDSNVVKDSNLKEYNGQHPKRPHDSSGRKSGPSRTMNLSHNTTGSKLSVNNNSHDKKTEIPSYLISTKIPLAGTVYTCIYCEQTFVSESTACSHTCEKLLRMTYEQNCGSKNTGDSSCYVCEICNQSFSRHASLIAHQSVHEEEDGDNESDRDSYDENIIFFGQKKKKKTKVIRKVITDEDGNYV